MKLLSQTLAVSAVVLAAGSANQALAVDYTDNLLHWYRFDSPQVEQGGQYYFNNSAIPTYTDEGLAGGANDPLWSNGSVAVSGTSDYVRLSGTQTSPLVGLSEFTISLMFQSNGPLPASYDMKLVGAKEAYLLGPNSESSPGTIRFVPAIQGAGNNAPEWASALRSTTAVDDLYDGEWHMLTVTYDEGAMAMYIDGVLDNSSTITGLSNYAIQSRSGSDQSDGINWYGTGGTQPETLYDEVRYYSVALTGDQVSDVYNAVIPEPTSFAALAAGGLLAGLARRRS